MKRITVTVLLIVLFVLLLVLYVPEDGNIPGKGNITFAGVIESVSVNSMMIMVSSNINHNRSDLGFDKASVSFNKDSVTGFTPAAGQIVEAEILPQIRESYPVQVTAVKIILWGEIDFMTGYRKITPEAAKSIMDKDTGVIILDVRTMAEYSEGHIKNSMLISDTDIGKIAPVKLSDKNATILVYCRSGRRSEAASRKLVEMGYTGIYDFGGIIDWKYGTTK